MKRFLIVWSLLLFCFTLGLSQNTTDRPKFPRKIAKKCNQVLELKFENLNKNQDVVSDRIFLLFANAQIDTVCVNDTIKYSEVLDTVITRRYLRMKSGEIYLLNSGGKLIVESALQNMIIPCFLNTYYMMESPDAAGNISYVLNNVQEITTYSDLSGTETYNSFCYDFKTINNQLPIIVKKNGKWGMIEVSGKMVEDFQYDKIEYDNEFKRFCLYKRNLLAKLIATN